MPSFIDGHLRRECSILASQQGSSEHRPYNSSLSGLIGKPKDEASEEAESNKSFMEGDDE
jgi:hypothetical protein